MRLFFLLLVLANIGFFAWQYSQGGRADTGGPAPPPATDPGVPSLTLLSERSAGEASDAGAVPETTGQEPAPPSEPAPPPPPVRKVCVSVGPFDRREAAERARTTAARDDITATLQVQKTRQHVGYWVRMPDELSIGEARSLLRELKSKGVRDVSIVPQEQEGEYVLSLGVFSRRDTMQNRRSTLRRLGYEPEVVDRFRPAESYLVRLVYEGPDETVMDEALQEVVGQPAEVPHEETLCP